MNGVMEKMDTDDPHTAREWLFLQAPARADQARRLRHALADFLRNHDWTEDAVDVLSLAVGEACNNAVSYSPPDAFVSLYAEITSRFQLQVEVRNPGGDFDPDPSRLQNLPNDDAIHGRGFALMYHLMDEVHVTRDGSDMVVRMTKCLPN